MVESKGGTAGASSTKIWLLGSEHPGADRSIPWHECFGNLNDADVILVDLTTMTEQVLKKINGDNLAHARESIADKMFDGGTIIVVTQARFSVERSDLAISNYGILPATLETKKVPTGLEIRVGADHDFKAYIDGVKKFTFQIDRYRATFRRAPTKTTKVALAETPGQEVTDNSGNNLGLTLQAVTIDHGDVHETSGTGRLVFLPPPSGSAYDGIGRILSAYGKASIHGEAPPPWAEKVSPARANQLQAEIAKLGEQRDQVQGRMDALARERDEVLGHRRLLYLKGAGLEAAVVDAFRLLGLKAEQAGGADEGDCVLDMGTGGYARGVVEVKGADSRTRQQDIVQCAKWVDVWYAREGKLPKGVFVPNQHRMKEYPKSEQERLRFEPNELEYAKAKDVCIIPSCALFEAAKRVLDGEAPDRTKIAEKIAGTKGVLEGVF